MLRRAVPPTVNLNAVLGTSAGGIAATLVDLAVLTVQVEAGAPIGIAAFIAAVCGATVQFAINKRAFGDRSRTTPAQIARYALVALAAAVFMAIAMHVVAVELGVPYLVAKLICAVLVFAAWTYRAQRRFVFRPVVATRLAQPASASLF